MKDSLIFSFNHMSKVFDPETQTPLIFFYRLLNLRKFFTLAQISQKTCQITILSSTYLPDAQPKKAKNII